MFRMQDSLQPPDCLLWTRAGPLFLLSPQHAGKKMRLAMGKSQFPQCSTCQRGKGRQAFTSLFHVLSHLPRTQITQLNTSLALPRSLKHARRHKHGRREQPLTSNVCCREQPHTRLLTDSSIGKQPEQTTSMQGMKRSPMHAHFLLRAAEPLALTSKPLPRPLCHCGAHDGQSGSHQARPSSNALLSRAPGHALSFLLPALRRGRQQQPPPPGGV